MLFATSFVVSLIVFLLLSQVFWSDMIKHGVWPYHLCMCDHLLSKIAKRRSDELDGAAEH